MAITNAQQYQQLFSKGGRIGLKGGGADMGAEDKAQDRADKGYGNTGGPDRSKTSDAQDRNQRAQVRAAQVRAVENLIDRPTFGFTDAAKVNLLSPKSIGSGIFSYATGVPFLGSILANMGPFNNKQFFTDKVLTSKNPQDYDEDDYEDYMSARMKGDIDAYGNPIGGRDSGNQILPIITPYQQSIVAQEPEVDPNSLAGLLANRQAYRFMADGGRAGFMGGGMPDDFIGGLADGNLDEMGRQMYGLGKLVKKATRAVKKIVKSPVGKAALLAGGAGLFGYGPAAGLFSSGKGLAFKEMLAKGILKKGATDFTLANLSPFKTIGLASLASGLMSQPEEDEEETYYRGQGLDIAAIRRDPYAARGAAYGFYAEGGNVKEPVAKDTMPLLDMNGMEKDYRADGGFVPIGRMERADDVPARLSKNEFVFTADAVKNAGDGDVDKGAEVMYNMMKNLESGGKVSEESQGLDGARDMFQTSKRLEEVL